MEEKAINFIETYDKWQNEWANTITAFSARILAELI